MRVNDLLRGLETVTFRISVGTAEVALYAVPTGLSTGTAPLVPLPTLPPDGQRWVLVHDIGEALRN